MDISKGTKPQWVLIAIKNGKEIKAGKFVTDVLAAQFARDYKIPEWRIDGPRKSSLSSETVLT